MIARVVISGLLFGQTNQNTVFFRRDDAVWPADGDTLVQAIKNSWIGVAAATGIRDRVTTSQVWNNISAYNTGSPGEAPISLPIAITGARSGANQDLMPYSCYILQLRCGVGGKRGRGRQYIPGPEPGAYKNGILQASHITIWNTVIGQLAAAFMGGSPTSGWSLVVANHNTPSVDHFTVISLQIASVSGVQRRRNIGVGV